MSAIAEKPQVTEAESPEEWQAERSLMVVQGRGWLDLKKAEQEAKWHTERLERERVRRSLLAEEREQLRHRDEIRRENEAEAAEVLRQTCMFCFTVHAGEC